MAPASRDGLPSAAPGLGGAAFNSTENIQLGDGVNGNMNGVDGRYSAQALQSVPEPDSIAIIGMACQFPQDAENVEKFWQLMMEGKSAMTEFPPGKFNIDAHYHPDHTRNSSMSNRGGHFLKSSGAAFDAPFFSLTKTEASSMDPQQRILMENVYLALENSGITMQQAAGSETSVYVGAFTNDYQKSILGKDPDASLKYMPTGTSNSILANRVSWFFDLKGTSLTLDTACSSSLVAFHLACQDLRDGNARMAIVSGVSIIEDPELFYRMSTLGFLSPDSKCYSFDHRANGYSRGEGVGTLIIKPLHMALRDGDTIRAVVRGTGVNSDGRTPGITLPSKIAQERLIRSVYSNAGLDLRHTGYVEAHGTGTPAGDPLEAAAIASSWEGRAHSPPLLVGALKSNVGHLEGASGVAGLIKSVMVLEKGIIPPNINFEKVNPQIPLQQWNIDFPLFPTPWPTQGLRRASINSFGFGGTNAHAVLDDAYHYLKRRHVHGLHNTTPPHPAPQLTGISGNSSMVLKPRVFVWSSSDEAGTRRIIECYQKHFNPDISPTFEDEYLDNLAYTLSEKRTRFPYKTYMIGGSISEIQNKLSSIREIPSPIRSTTGANLGFVFTGQGAQWAGMGLQLLQYPVFRSSVEEADAFLLRSPISSSWGLLEEFKKSPQISSINQPAVSQTICTVLQVALIDLLASWKVHPTRVVGHSSGEIAAAYAAGAISRESAWKIAYYRGVVSAIETGQKGAMMAVGLTVEELAPYISMLHSEVPGELVIACFNSPRSLTVSGDVTKIDSLKVLLDANQVFARKLKVQNAYHSSHMKPVAGQYLALMGKLEPTSATPEKRPMMFSSVTSERIPTERLATAQYWVDNMVSQVRFSQALAKMCSPEVERGRRRIGRNGDSPVQVLLEVGPHGALQSACKDTLSAQQISIPFSSTLRRNTDAINSALDAVGRIFCEGCIVDLNAVNHDSNYDAGDDVTAKMLVDLPGYVFNHSQSYWPESRFSKNFRFRKYPRHDLLGSSVPDWNPSEPRWRNIIRISENPWVEDHQITGSMIYPGVGYIVMAIEASRQLQDFSAAITGFRLRDISIMTALQIPDVEDGVEVTLSMRAANDSSLSASSIWKEFWISSYNPDGDNWVEHCRGKISVELDKEAESIDGEREAIERRKMFKDLFREKAEVCRLATDMTSLYVDLESIGLKFGPLFKNLSNAFYAGNHQGEAIATVTVPEIASIMPKMYLEPHVIHPATMDSMLHLFLAAFQDLTGGVKIQEPLVPIFLQEVWLSASISNEPGNQFLAHGRVQRTSHKKLAATITVWDQQGNGRFTVEGMQTTPLQNSVLDTASERQVCYNMDWQPDVDLMDVPAGAKYFERIMSKSFSDDEEMLRITKDLQLATIIYIQDAVSQIESHPFSGDLLWHHAKFLAWMQHWVSKYGKGAMMHQESEWQEIISNDELKREFLDRVCSESQDGKLLRRMGPKIMPILRQEADAIELMFGDDILEVYYRETVGTKRIQLQLESYLRTLSHKYANLKVLEIGAGTGGTTGAVLSSLSPRERGDFKVKLSTLASYTYTDISAGFFENAKQKFKAWRNVLDFKVLNIEHDTKSQGFEDGGYDIIVAANVLHATADMNSTLRNVRRLLKTGGKLLLVEGTQPQLIRGPMCFGLLPGWWLGVEPERQLGPLLTPPGWDRILSDNGFGGLELCMSDSKDTGCAFQSLLISTAIETQSTKIHKQVLIVVSSEKASDDVSIFLSKSLVTLGVETSIVDYGELHKHRLSDAVCIVLSELVGPVLSNLDQAIMDNTRHLLTTATGVLWVTKDPISHPEVSAITGLIRTLRWERDLDESNLIILGLEGSSDLGAQILRIFKRQFFETNDEKHAEYLFKDDLFHINRLVPSEPVNDFLMSKIAKPVAQLKPFAEDSSRVLSLSIRFPGLLNTLEFIDYSAYAQPLKPAELEVKVHATGLNFRDVMVAMGEIDDVALGLEASGVVVRVGKEAGQNFDVGDRVMLLSTISGCFQTYARTTHELAVKIPPNLSFEAAAGIPVTYSTAYYCLVDVARLGQGDSILIHAAAGGVGQAAIMLAQHLGAVIYVTVSSEAKKQLLVENYSIPAENIFSSRGLSFAEGILRVTNNRGVDVILNSLSGEALRRSWDCIAPFGRFVEIGKKDIYANGKLDMFAFSKSATFAAVDLNLVINLDPKTGGRLLRESLKLWEKGIIRTSTPFNVLNYGQIEEAFRLLQSGKHIGKVVLKAEPGNLVPTTPLSQSPYEFPANASYILPGGLGGIGRSTAKWMVSRGARNLIFLSRTGASSEKPVVELISELKTSNCAVSVYKCDISDRDRLCEVIEECGRSMPPIRGVIHGGMQLKDSAFENMSLEDFQAALRPKIQGSWNLHNLLPKDLDFFIMLSSVSGLVGNRGQANYAAGNNFQDALACYRVSHGLPGVSLDLGNILTVGYIAENIEAVGNMAAIAQEGIREDELHCLFEYHVDPRNRSWNPLDSQVAIGLVTSSTFRRKGMPEPTFLSTPLFTHLRFDDYTTAGTLDEESGLSIQSLLQSSQSQDDAAQVVAEGIVKRLSTTLSIPAGDIDTGKPIHFYGVDSLVAMEFRNWFSKSLGSDIPVLYIMGNSSISTLSYRISSTSRHVNVVAKAAEGDASSM